MLMMPDENVVANSVLCMIYWVFIGLVIKSFAILLDGQGDEFLKCWRWNRERMIWSITRPFRFYVTTRKFRIIQGTKPFSYLSAVFPLSVQVLRHANSESSSNRIVLLDGRTNGGLLSLLRIKRRNVLRLICKTSAA